MVLIKNVLVECKKKKERRWISKSLKKILGFKDFLEEGFAIAYC